MDCNEAVQYKASDVNAVHEGLAAGWLQGEKRRLALLF